MRLVFLGTPDDAVPALRALHRVGHDIALVITQPDRRRGRGAATTPSPVRAAADELGLAVRTPERAREVIDDVGASGATLGVVVAFGQLLPEVFLGALPDGFVNVHFSLLPRWRGAAPVERAILAGDAETGVCVMRVDAGLDTGPVYAERRTPIAPDDTAGELRARLVTIGAELVVETIPRLADLQPVSQAGDATYADKLSVDEFRIDWSRPPVEIDRVIRAGNPRPGAWTTVDGRRLKIWRAHRRDDGSLDPAEVQPEGKARMSWDSWLRGHGGSVPVLGS